MKSVHVVCLFAMLVSIFVLAQSGRAPHGNRPNGLAIAQKRHPALAMNPYQMPQGTPFAPRGTRALKVRALRPTAQQSSGLDFAPAVVYDSGGYYANSVAVADVNGDGIPDILVANQCDSAGSCADSGWVGVLLGKGDGTFQKAAAYASGGFGATSVAVADVNGDGRPDLLVANPCADPRLCNERLCGRVVGQR